MNNVSKSCYNKGIMQKNMKAGPEAKILMFYLKSPKSLLKRGVNLVPLDEGKMVLNYCLSSVNVFRA